MLWSKLSPPNTFPKRRKVRETGRKRIESNGLGKCHTNDGLDEDGSGCVRVAPNRFCGLHAYDSHPDGGSETTESSLDAAGDT